VPLRQNEPFLFLLNSLPGLAPSKEKATKLFLSPCVESNAERTSLLKISKNLAIDSKIILLNYQNNFVGRLSIISDAAKNFDVLATVRAFYMITMIIMIYNYYDHYLTYF